jgi:hypothetical protein
VDKKARIFYSGRMLGYMRYGVNGLKEEPPPCTLLGMGDNLAPKYEARLGDNEQFKSRNPPISNMPNIFYHCCPGKIA